MALLVTARSQLPDGRCRQAFVCAAADRQVSAVGLLLGVAPATAQGRDFGALQTRVRIPGFPVLLVPKRVERNSGTTCRF